ncbi:hypothetical protein A3D77_02135 [Candidatus Gottesmanbacteria bacterium RIFCSPHIGHO2_02_FULL_39_11]|uniref:Uncharacterized protein n=1 Tax=Candidatus Gottesmanbacteria bacterium RIFCSPHIGHO2_02_FULL_39_11 TaxID=1798382 RepID=A0A1F5ZUD9_9BACT|nr:MAG: hypothetical protein A3D77_02135 [Candidatus Gottesmanbacteria bacterium RIFCSPHIGHO2_02_FULL_39_11]
MEKVEIFLGIKRGAFLNYHLYACLRKVWTQFHPPGGGLFEEMVPEEKKDPGEKLVVFPL